MKGPWVGEWQHENFSWDLYHFLTRKQEKWEGNRDVTDPPMVVEWSLGQSSGWYYFQKEICMKELCCERQALALMERIQCLGTQKETGWGAGQTEGGGTTEGGIVTQNLGKARAQEWRNKTETLILESGNRGGHQNQGQGKSLVMGSDIESVIPGVGLSITAEPAGAGQPVRKSDGIQTQGANPSWCTSLKLSKESLYNLV